MIPAVRKDQFCWKVSFQALNQDYSFDPDISGLKIVGNAQMKSGKTSKC